MGIKLTTPQSAITEYFIRVQEIIRDEIIQILSYLGESCVKKIRDRSAQESWIDQTGNLRSSIQYAVYEYGKETIRSSFSKILDGNKGLAEADKMLDDLASRYSDTYALVVVAGMNYAEYVEARDNKDVLASTQLWAEGRIEKYMQSALNKATEKINRLKL